MHSALMWLSKGQVDTFVRGCQLLGSGGGGHATIAGPLLEQVLRERGPVQVIDCTQADPQWRVAALGAVGSPTVMRERVPSSEEFVRAVRALERYCGYELDAVVPLEIGGVNGPLGVLVGAVTGLPVLDADTMGRAFPRLDQCTLHGVIPASPLALANPSGGVVVIDEVSDAAVEVTVRGMLSSLGGWAAMAIHPGPLSAGCPALIHGSVSRALQAGSRLGDEQGWVGTVLHLEGMAGRHGVAVLAGERDPESTLRVDLGDEYLTALLDGEPLGAVPEIIALLDARTHRPIGVPDLRVGQRLRLVVLSAPEELRHDPHRWGLPGHGLVDAGYGALR